MIKIKFLGAAESVTGSRFLLETDQQTILIDCGLFQERDLAIRNWDKFPFNPAKIEALLLTHAHVDHCGYLPKLIKEGYQGEIYCTAPTTQMTKVSLLDAGHLQESDAESKRKRHAEEGSSLTNATPASALPVAPRRRPTAASPPSAPTENAPLSPTDVSAAGVGGDEGDEENEPLSLRESILRKMDRLNIGR